MRAVERTPWAEKRSEAHDSLCRRIAFYEEGCGWKCQIEAPIGAGFADVFAVKRIDSGQRLVAVIWEAKSLDERFSAGDLIRQLKWYREQLLKCPVKYDEIRLAAAFETRSHAESFRWMLEHEGIHMMWAEDDTEEDKIG